MPLRRWPTRPNTSRWLVSAILTLAAEAAILLLPPISIKQFAEAETAARGPAIALIVAALLIIFERVRTAIAVGVPIVLLLFAGIQYGYMLHNVHAGETAEQQARPWPTVSHSGSPQGHQCNRPNAYGRACATWTPSTVSIRLISEGPASQGFAGYSGGPATSDFVFSTVLKHTAGALAGQCGIQFGKTDPSHYFVFDIRDDPEGYGAVAHVAQIIPRGPPPGYKEYLLGDTGQLPYVNRFSLPRVWENDETKLMIAAHGNYYQFYVDDRRVISLSHLDQVPNHEVNVGIVDPGQSLGGQPVGSLIDCRFTNTTMHVKTTS